MEENIKMVQAALEETYQNLNKVDVNNAIDIIKEKMQGAKV